MGQIKDLNFDLLGCIGVTLKQENQSRNHHGGICLVAMAMRVHCNHEILTIFVTFSGLTKMLVKSSKVNGFQILDILLKATKYTYNIKHLEADFDVIKVQLEVIFLQRINLQINFHLTIFCQIKVQLPKYVQIKVQLKFKNISNSIFQFFLQSKFLLIGKLSVDQFPSSYIFSRAKFS